MKAKKPSSILEYPVVLRKILENLTITAPDLGIWASVPLPEKKLINGSYVIPLSDEDALRIGKEILRVYRKIGSHIVEKKWKPDASTIRSSVETGTKENISVPEFARLVNKHIKVSENTIRRDVDRGIIPAIKSSGGHRKIPKSELNKYIESYNLFEKTKTSKNLDL